MNRRLQYFNLAGVMALAILCIAQWRTNRLLQLSTLELEGAFQKQKGAMEELQATLQGCAEDLKGFREQLIKANMGLKESETKLGTAELRAHQLSLEREAFQANREQWVSAVAQRDEKLNSLGEELKKTSLDRHEVVEQFNELALKYNAVVKDLNEVRAQARVQSAVSPTPIPSEKKP